MIQNPTHLKEGWKFASITPGVPSVKKDLMISIQQLFVVLSAFQEAEVCTSLLPLVYYYAVLFVSGSNRK